jgi:hypothetical protein
MVVPGSLLALVGTTQAKHVCGTSSPGTEKVVSCCEDCGSCVFGGRYGIDNEHTVYVDTLDDDCAERFEPKIALFVKDRSSWAKLQAGMTEFEEMPPR